MYSYKIILLMLALVLLSSCQYIQSTIKTEDQTNLEIGKGPIHAGVIAKVYTASLGRYQAMIIEIAPTSFAMPNKTYSAEIYENGVLRAKSPVLWNQSEINGKYHTTIAFPISNSQYEDYNSRYIDNNTFTLKMR